MSNENKQPDEREMNRYLVAQDDPNREAILNAHDVVVKNGGYSIGIVGAMLDAARATQQATKCGGRPAFDMLAHLQRQREFSERTFGPGPRTKGVCDHIRKELAEIESNPTDLTEWIDVVILALDGAWRAGAWPQQIIETLVAKQTKNEGRDWPDWRTADPDKAIEHDRSKDATTPSPVAGSAGQAPSSDVIVRIKRPEDYEDVDAQLVIEDFIETAHHSDAWHWEVIAVTPTSTVAPAAAAPNDDLRKAVVSLELTAAWLDGGCDPARASTEIRAALDRIRPLLAAAQQGDAQ